MTENSTIGKKLKISGLVTAVTSLLIGLLFAVTLGRSCGFLGGLVIVFCFLVSVAGVILFFSGLFIDKRSNRSDSENQMNSA